MEAFGEVILDVLTFPAVWSIRRCLARQLRLRFLWTVKLAEAFSCSIRRWMRKENLLVATWSLFEFAGRSICINSHSGFGRSR
ncbi:hypothetical protein RISK_003314 [Rhodopirellula islandica]|uniref:Uncharacterized protein n=1 Tax=Rhodopirellula islandica TaxID=595434 RepID=A0A0J1BDL4_RHOIS|nr:hypothetical protein RISK_003314 [Rhodopirellula islandica]